MWGRCEGLRLEATQCRADARALLRGRARHPAGVGAGGVRKVWGRCGKGVSV